MRTISHSKQALLRQIRTANEGKDYKGGRRGKATDFFLTVLSSLAVLKGSLQIALTWATRLQTILTLVYAPVVPSCLRTYSAVILNTTMVREHFLLYLLIYFTTRK